MDSILKPSAQSPNGTMSSSAWGRRGFFSCSALWIIPTASMQGHSSTALCFIVLFQDLKYDKKTVRRFEIKWKYHFCYCMAASRECFLLSYSNSSVCQLNGSISFYFNSISIPNYSNSLINLNYSVTLEILVK